MYMTSRFPASQPPGTSASYSRSLSAAVFRSLSSALVLFSFSLFSSLTQLRRGVAYSLSLLWPLTLWRGVLTANCHDLNAYHLCRYNRILASPNNWSAEQYHMQVNKETPHRRFFCCPPSLPPPPSYISSPVTHSYEWPPRWSFCCYPQQKRLLYSDWGMVKWDRQHSALIV